MKKWHRYTLAVFSVLILAGGYALYHAVDKVLPYSAIRPYRHVVQGLTPESKGMRYDTLTVSVEENIRLKGWFVHTSTQPSKGTVVLLHGIGSSKSAKLGLAALLTANGYDCVLYDSRATGESGGQYCTFGFYEKRDVSRVIDAVKERYPGSGPYAIFGSSLGGAVAVQALSVDARIVCGIAESPFATLRETIHDYAKRLFSIPVDAVTDAALRRSEQIASFAVDSVKPEVSAAMVHQPVMIVHGLNDERISPEYGRRVFEQLRSPEKVWYPIPGAMHNDVYTVGGVEYQKKILAFLEEHLK